MASPTHPAITVTFTPGSAWRGMSSSHSIVKFFARQLPPRARWRAKKEVG
jgi:hypothetical protein